MEMELAASFEAGEAIDAVIAISETQIIELWRLREQISEAQRLEGKNVKHDISIPISKIPAFLHACDAALLKAFPEISLVCFGHLGDGNLHYNCGIPAQGLANAAEINKIVFAHVDQFGGSISAEHGIGQLKRAELPMHKSPVALDLMRAMKATLDPHNLMNPGKVL
jgi:FAD/FMN-containing dehydrogenase